MLPIVYRGCLMELMVDSLWNCFSEMLSCFVLYESVLCKGYQDPAEATSAVFDPMSTKGVPNPVLDAENSWVHRTKEDLPFQSLYSSWEQTANQCENNNQENFSPWQVY